MLHSFLELLQPPLLIALCGAAGVAAGRAARTTAVPAIIGGAVCFVLFSFYWVFSAPPGYALAPMQMQPMAIGLAPGTDPAKLPANWLADAPGEFSSVWHRRLVHQPTVAGHNIYLLGLIAICCGLAMRGRIGRRAALGGLAVAAVGAAAQLLVSPL